MMSAYSSAPSSQQKDSAGQRIRQKAAQEFHLLTERLSAFGEKAKRVLKGENRHQGQYTNLNESLLSEEDMSTEQQQRNGDYYAGQQSATTAFTGGARVARSTDHQSVELDIPSDAEMMVQTTTLAKEAAELLWETIAFHAGCDDKDPQIAVQMTDLVEKAEMLNSQLRGLIRNHLAQGGGGTATDEQVSETMLATALEVKDMLDSCLGEYSKAIGDEGRPAVAQSNLQAVETDDPNTLGTLDAVQVDAPLIDLGDALPPPQSTSHQQQLPQSTSSMPVDPFASSDAAVFQAPPSQN